MGTSPFLEKSRRIGLVAADGRARAAIAKFLEPKITELETADKAAALSDLLTFAAVVFVHPVHDDDTETDIAVVTTPSPRPSVIVLSDDASWGEKPGVDARVALGERASEVAAQVMAGLAELGIEA